MKGATQNHPSSRPTAKAPPPAPVAVVHSNQPAPRAPMGGMATMGGKY